MNPSTDTSLLRTWLERVPSTPLYDWWSAFLVGLLGVAALLILLTALLLILDWMALARLHASSERRAGRPPPAPKSKFGLVYSWLTVLHERAARGHGGGVAELEPFAEARYDWSAELLSMLQGAAVMTGLLFTFLGLGLTLDGLASAMQAVESGESADIAMTLGKVRDALPNLGMAFASSVAGVGLALAISMLNGLLGAARSRLTVSIEG